MRDMHTDEDGLKFDIGACVTDTKCMQFNLPCNTLGPSLGGALLYIPL